MLHTFLPKKINWYLAACLIVGLAAYHLVVGGESSPARAQTLPDIEVKMSLFLPIAKNSVR